MTDLYRLPNAVVNVRCQPVTSIVLTSLTLRSSGVTSEWWVARFSVELDRKTETEVVTVRMHDINGQSLKNVLKKKQW